MKILVCTYEFPPLYSSGTGNVVYYVVDRLRKMGVQCTVCAPIGGDVELCGRGLIRKTHNYAIFDHLYRILYFWHKAARYVRQNHSGYDAVWLHNPSPIDFRTGLKKSLVTIHSTYYGSSVLEYSLMVHMYHKSMAWFEKRSYENMGGLFTGVSRQVCYELEELGVGRERITYIPNGVDIEKFRPRQNKKELRKRLDIPEESIILLSLGRLTEAKQPDKLIKVFSLVQRSIRDITLVVAGGGELLEGTKRLVRERGTHKVRFLGHVDHDKDVPELYACVDFYITTSKSEGQPLTLLEAMASGLPCIVSDIPALSSVVQDAQCGIAIDFKDEEKAAQEIIGYIKEDHSKHATNARKYAVRNLDWKIIASRYLEEFEKL